MADLKSLVIGPSKDGRLAVLEFEDTNGGVFTITIGQPNLGAVITQLQKVAEEIRNRTQ